LLSKHGNRPLLTPVAEVVVSSAHVMQHPWLSWHHDDSPNQRGRRVVQQHVQLVGGGSAGSISRGLVVTRRTQIQGSIHKGSGLCKGALSHVARSPSCRDPEVGITVVKHTAVVVERKVNSDRVVAASISQTHNIMAISSLSAFTSIAGLSITSGIAVVVGIGSSPLNVNAVAGGQLELVGLKVVLHGRKRLDNVSAFSSHVQVPQFARGASRASGALLDVEGVRAVLECSAELIGVDSESESLNGDQSNVNSGVFFHRGHNSLIKVFIQGGIGSSGIIVIGGDVIANAKDAFGDLGGAGRVEFDILSQVTNGGDGPIVLQGLIVYTITQMVHARPGAFDTDRCRHVV